MSVINQMLQDLEKRQVGTASEPLPDGVHSAGPDHGLRKVRQTRRVLGLAGVLLAVVAAFVWWPRHLETSVVTLVPPLSPDAGLVAQAVSPPVTPLPLSVPFSAPVAAQAPSAKLVKAVKPVSNKPAKPSRTEQQRIAREAALQKKRAHVSVPVLASEAVVAPSAIAKTAVAEDASQRAEGNYQAARLAFSGGRSTETAARAGEALQLLPKHKGARQLLIRQSVEQNHIPQAIELLREGIALFPAETAWWNLLAQLELGRGELSAARAVIDAGQRQAAGSAEFNSLGGAIAQRQGDFDAAADFYRKALRLDARSGRDWVGLALALERQGHAAESSEAFRRALLTDNLNGELAQLARTRLARLEGGAVTP